MNGRRIIGLVAVFGVIAAALIIIVLVGGDTTTALDAGRAAAEATSTTGAAAPGTSDPAPAVYVYDTIGFESVDALAGAGHDYPEDMFLTVKPGGCGQVLRWQAIEERWWSWEVCDPVQVTVAGIESFHRWFGVDDAEHYRCDPPASHLPQADGATTWTFTCRTDETTEETTVEVVGAETVTIGGEAVETTRLRYNSELAGASSGGSRIDRWFRADGLLVKEVSTTASSTTSPVGTVNYSEEYTITLRSLEPETD